MARKDAREELKEQILESKTYRKFQRIVDTIQQRFDSEKLKTEINSLHAGRVVRNLQATKINPRVMIEAMACEIRARSRLVEIRNSLVDERIELDRAMKTIENFLISEFDVDGMKYKNEKKAYFSRYLRRATWVITDIDSLIDKCDNIVKDVDQNGFSTRVIEDSLRMVYGLGAREKSV